MGLCGTFFAMLSSSAESRSRFDFERSLFVQMGHSPIGLVRERQSSHIDLDDQLARTKGIGLSSKDEKVTLWEELIRNTATLFLHQVGASC